MNYQVHSEIDSLSVMLRCGVLQEERGDPQEVLVSVKMTQSLPRHARDLGDCLDYGALAGRIQRFEQSGHCDLLESMAQSLADEIMLDARVQDVEVSFRKPHIVPNAKAVGITVRASRGKEESEAAFDALIAARKVIFDGMIAAVCSPPAKVDAILKQDIYQDSIQIQVNDPENGNLVYSCRQSFSDGKSCDYYYSIYFVGNVLRIGVHISDTTYADALSRGMSDQIIRQVWNANPKIHWRADGFMYEWEFIVDPRDLLPMEFYVKGMRHLHYQVGRVLSDLNLSNRVAINAANASQEVESQFQSG